MDRSEQTITHNNVLVLKYHFQNVDDHSFIAVIKQLDCNYTTPPSDNYVYALKYREILFQLQDKLHTYIKNVFERFRLELLQAGYTALDTNRIYNICKYHITSQNIPRNYSFVGWDTDAWILARFFSPYLSKPKNKDRIVDAHQLLEILENFSGFEEFSCAANAAKNDRHNLYGHLSKAGISKSDFESGKVNCKILLGHLSDKPETEISYWVPNKHRRRY